MMLRDEDSAFFGPMQGALTLFKPTLHEHGFDRTASPHIGAGIERIAQDVPDQALRGDLPNQLLRNLQPVFEIHADARAATALPTLVRPSSISLIAATSRRASLARTRLANLSPLPYWNSRFDRTR